MRRWVIGSSVLLAGVVAGCGTHGSHPISHGMTPQQVKKEVLARIDNWHAVSESMTEVIYRAHSPRAVYRVKLISEANPASFRLDVVPATGTSYEVIDNGLNTIAYQSGSSHYSVLTADPQSWTEFRILGIELPSVIQASRAVSVSVRPKEVVLHMMTPVAAGITAKTTLWFDLVTNTPMRWQSTWPGGTLQETPSHVAVNPNISSATFAFNPPAGVKPEVALTAQGTELDLARSQVSFPIVLPVASVSLELNGVNVDNRGKAQVVLLTYQTSNGDPVVITESKAATFKPPAGMSVVTETVGVMQVKVGSMPDGAEMAAFTTNKTLVVAEGPTSVVDALVNAWGNASPSSPP